MSDPSDFLYRALTVPYTGEHWRGRPAEGADEGERWIAFADRIGYRAQHRAAYHKAAGPRLLGAVAGFLSGRPYEVVDRHGRHVDAWETLDGARRAAAGKAHFELRHAQLVVSAAHAYGLKMQAQAHPDSTSSTPVTARTMTLSEPACAT
jgi:hypothetical protein